MCNIPLKQYGFFSMSGVHNMVVQYIKKMYNE